MAERELRVLFEQFVRSEAPSRRVAWILRDKLPLLAQSAISAGKVHTDDLERPITSDVLYAAMKVHASYIATHIASSRSRQSRITLRPELLEWLPCCSLQKGSFPFCNPRC